jgi:hypothetical protein
MPANHREILSLLGVWVVAVVAISGIAAAQNPNVSVRRRQGRRIGSCCGETKWHADDGIIHGFEVDRTARKKGHAVRGAFRRSEDGRVHANSQGPAGTDNPLHSLAVN